jgi:hypothetical protein
MFNKFFGKKNIAVFPVRFSNVTLDVFRKQDGDILKPNVR